MKTSEYLRKHGISKERVIPAIFTLKILKYAFWFGSIGVCYQYSPLLKMINTAMAKKYIDVIKTKYPNIEPIVLTKTHEIAKNKYVQLIPKQVGISSAKFTTALIEGIILYKLISPVTTPIQYYSIVHTFGGAQTNLSAKECFVDITTCVIDTELGTD